MNNQHLQSLDPARSYLRSVVTAVDCGMADLKKIMTAASPAATDRLIDNWEALVALLALGPEPEYRECPFCGNLGMYLAARCRSRWEKLPRLVPQPEACDP